MNLPHTFKVNNLYNDSLFKTSQNVNIGFVFIKIVHVSIELYIFIKYTYIKYIFYHRLMI